MTYNILLRKKRTFFAVFQSIQNRYNIVSLQPFTLAVLMNILSPECTEEVL